MKLINHINEYSYNSKLIDNIELFIKLNNSIDYFGDKYWYKNGLFHRENDKSAIEYSDGGKQWWVNGKFIKRNYDNNYVVYNDKFFNIYGEIYEKTN
jgi:hypothetical protein